MRKKKNLRQGGFTLFLFRVFCEISISSFPPFYRLCLANLPEWCHSFHLKISRYIFFRFYRFYFHVTRFFLWFLELKRTMSEGTILPFCAYYIPLTYLVFYINYFIPRFLNQRQKQLLHLLQRVLIFLLSKISTTSPPPPFFFFILLGHCDPLIFFAPSLIHK